MGAWSKRRLRGGGGVIPSAPVSIVDVIEQDGNNVHVVFDADVTFVNSFTHDGAFDVNGVQPNDGVQVDAVTISVGTPATNAGDPWTLTFRPSWLLQQIAGPQSGLVS